MLELSKGLGLRRFIFASSEAACAFPRPGLALTETSPPDGDHVYARTKAIGERLLAEYREHFPATIVRFAALFSDWCEYPPLFMFLETWLSDAWNARVLGGRGRSAIPYLHIDDAVVFFLAPPRPATPLAPGTVVQASPDGAVSHAQLFEESTLLGKGRPGGPSTCRRRCAVPGCGAARSRRSPDRPPALRAALDGPLHRPRDDGGRQPHPGAARLGAAAAAAGRCVACRSCSRTGAWTRSSGTAPTARR